MSALYLVVTIADQQVALPADNIESVVEIEGITPVPLVAPHVAGLFALRSRVLTAIDSRQALALPPRDPQAIHQAVIVKSDGHLYGLIVDGVDDVVSIDAVPSALTIGLQGGWMRAAHGMIEHDGMALLLIDPARLLAGPTALAA